MNNDTPSNGLPSTGTNLTTNLTSPQASCTQTNPFVSTHGKFANYNTFHFYVEQTAKFGLIAKEPAPNMTHQQIINEIQYLQDLLYKL